jgi:hypothetical protein
MEILAEKGPNYKISEFHLFFCDSRVLSESFALILVTQSKIKKSFRETIALVKKNNCSKNIVKKNNYNKNNNKEEQLYKNNSKEEQLYKNNSKEEQLYKNNSKEEQLQH